MTALIWTSHSKVENVECEMLKNLTDAIYIRNFIYYDFYWLRKTYAHMTA